MLKLLTDEAYSPSEHARTSDSSPASLLSLTASEDSPLSMPEPLPESDSDDTVVSISTTFHPGATLLPQSPNLILLSADSVFFYVHESQLVFKSANHFNFLLSYNPTSANSQGEEAQPIRLVSVPEIAAVINVLLHAVYEIPCNCYCPTLETIASAVDAMATYGFPPKNYITPSKPFFSLILNQAPVKPILAYALAASHDLDSLALPVSSHLLSFPLSTLTPELACKIGPLYLKRLFFLHLGRIQALRSLLLPYPHPHPPTGSCDLVEQKRVSRAWALALAWDARPDLPASVLESILCPLADRLSCDLCKEAIKQRARQLIVEWSMVKVLVYPLHAQLATYMDNVTQRSI